METKGKVLIVDHRKKEMDVLKKALEKKNYKVVSAENVMNGMKKAEKECPDIIILETKSQKGEDVIDVCRSYRKEDSKFKHVPIFMMIEREDYIANSLFENPRWSLFEALENKPESVKNMIDNVEKTLNETLKDTFVILFGYYKEEKDEAALSVKSDGHKKKKVA